MADLANLARDMKRSPGRPWTQSQLRGSSRDLYAQPGVGDLATSQAAEQRAMRSDAQRKRQASARKRRKMLDMAADELDRQALRGIGRTNIPADDEDFVAAVSVPRLTDAMSGSGPVQGWRLSELTPQTRAILMELQRRGAQGM